jgi:6-phosphogluconolactonase
MEEQRLSDLGSAGGRREIRIVEDAAAVSRAAAEEVAAALALGREGGVPAGLLSCALSGGSTPRALYRLLADPASPYRQRIAWNAIHFFWGDERHVPPDDPDSNFRMAREALLDRVPVPAAHVHRVAGEEPDAARAAARYERELIELFRLSRDTDSGRDGAPSAARRDWPRFDLVLLGLGEEGHTASLFPGSPLLAERRRLAAAVWVEAHRTWRITFTPPVINHAAAVIFLVSGAAKAAALAAVLEGEPCPERYPAQVVAPVDGRLLWIVDRAAAGQLRRECG